MAALAATEWKGDEAFSARASRLGAAPSSGRQAASIALARGGRRMLPITAAGADIAQNVRSQPMKRFVIFSLLLAASLMAPNAVAAANFRSTCRSGGGSTSDGNWTESSPYLISISQATVLSINRRVGMFEGHPGSAPRYVRCDVAESVAYSGMHAWDYNWSGNDGWMGAGWIGAASGPWFGSFYCTGYEAQTDVYAETCTHRADRHAGRIVVKFTIVAAYLQQSG